MGSLEVTPLAVKLLDNQLYIHLYHIICVTFILKFDPLEQGLNTGVKFHNNFILGQLQGAGH